MRLEAKINWGLVKEMSDRRKEMKKDCNCGAKFMDAEDFRDHLPCEGSLQDKLDRANKRIKELEEIVLSSEENNILYKYHNEGIKGSDEEMEKITKKLINFSIPREPKNV